jgi:hypothetical protein
MPFDSASTSRHVPLPRRGTHCRLKDRRSLGRLLVPPALVIAGLCATARADDPVDLPAPPGYGQALANDLNKRAQAVSQAVAANAPRQAVIWFKPFKRW